jgi:GT2 family glycosyltransferase
VQHEGVIMGLAGLCEHAGRLRAADAGGAGAMGRITREVSAVTAACMLVRSKLYRDLGGMDEGFAVALNDVDFCLRARQAGWRIVYCAESALYHFESLSLGRHYGGARAALEQREVRLLRTRWAACIEDDPFYNPLASLEPGREWQPAFPPRHGGVVPRAANPAAVA